MGRQRDNVIDILRSIGIIAVVGFHCGLLPEIFRLFHNPLFMFAAGMFHPVKPCQSWREYGGFLLKKIRRIYIPFVAITLVLTVLQPFLAKCHLASTQPYTLAEMPMKILTVFAMRVESINGPCWFLISYLEVSLFFELLRLLFHFTGITGYKMQMMLLTLVGVVLFPIGMYHNFPRELDESAILFIWYFLGYFAYPFHNKFIF